MTLACVTNSTWRGLIGDAWAQADSAEWLEVTDPANGWAIGVVPMMGAAETERAIAAAAAALPAWRDRPAAERAAILLAWRSEILAHREQLAETLTSEQGKPLAEARAEIDYAAAYVQWFAEEARRIPGDIIPSPWPDRRMFVMRQAIGVVAAITPWNFPAAMVTRKLAPALAAGCTVVLKPASQTPFTALALAALAQASGVPGGVLNVVTGRGEPIGDALLGSPLVRKLSFTGSTELGKQLMAKAAPSLKRLSLELGGNAPFIVFEDADLDAAVEGAIQSKFRNTGQTCVCANRLLVQARIAEAFTDRLTRRVAALRVGPGKEPGVEQGPLIDAAALWKVESHVAEALGKGAKVRTGGRRHALGGLFYQPTVIAGARPDMLIAREETFGPVAPVFEFSDEQEALEMANATPFGLAGYFYSRDVGRVIRVAEQLECGIVGVNTGLVSSEAAPFGGVKESGFGREGSRYGLDDYLSLKYVCVGGIETPA